MTGRAQATVLLIGMDASLLRTRRAVLRHAGFHVILADNLMQASAGAGCFRFETIIFCHSLNESFLERCISEVCPMQPEVPLLLLTPGHCEPLQVIEEVQQRVAAFRAKTPQPVDEPYFELESSRPARIQPRRTA